MYTGRRVGVLSSALLVAVLASNPTTASPAACSMRLSIVLTPDVPNPLDSGFLSSLLNNRINYRLTLLGQRPGSVIVTELEGPGPEYRCRNAVDAMRRDGRVLSIHLEQDLVLRAVSGSVPRAALDLRPPDLQSLEVAHRHQVDTSSDSDDAEAIMIAAGPWVLEEKSDVQPSLGGVASLYWAARHATQAWRVFLPVPLDGDDLGSENPVSAAGDAAPQAFAVQRDTGASRAPTALAYETGG